MKYEDVQGRLDRAKECLQKARLYVDAAECLMYQEGNTVDNDSRVLQMRVTRDDIWNIIVTVNKLIEELGK